MLQEYKRKRDFKVTTEPSGDGNKTRHGKSLTFVIQKHAATRLHYDFRLEIDEVMVSWAVPKGPSTSTTNKRLAMMTEDHPMEYSSFEGIIPAHQYGGGEVIIWDQGVYSPDEEQKYSWNNKDEANKRMREGLKKGKLSFYLKGEKLEGSWTLVRIHGRGKDTGKEWLLIKHHDDFENDERDVTAEDASVVSGLTLEDMKDGAAEKVWTKSGEKDVVRKKAASTKKSNSSNALKIAAKTAKKVTVNKEHSTELIDQGKKAPFPEFLAPMLATLADQSFKSDEWFFEPKLDGVRALAFVKGDKCTLTSRNKNDLTLKYPAIAKALTDYDDNYIFDGEVVALDKNGRPSFQHLQQSGVSLRSFKGRKTTDSQATLFYYVFDILYAQGRDLTKLTVTTRKKILREILKTNDVVRYVESLGHDGEAAFAACMENNLEGVVGKKESSIYECGARSKSWLKVKTNLSDEFVICGYTEGTGSRSHSFGSLLLGEYDKKGTLQYVGGVGTGFDAKKLKALLDKMKPLVSNQCPFKKKPEGKLNPVWLKPSIVVEVKYLERTQDNMLRAPVYLHAREDKNPVQAKASPVIHPNKT